jgi:Tfp pilus assembly protein PilV
MKDTPQKKEQGIVLMEAVIAVSVLAIMFAGVLELFTRSISTLRVTNDTLIATYLAQDTAEFLYAKRRYNKDVGTGVNDWANGIVVAVCPDEATSCGLETALETVRDLPGDLSQCASLNNCRLYIGADGTYTHDNVGTTETPFTREVRVKTIDNDTSGNPTAVRATITVSWEVSGGRLEQYVLPIVLYAK